MKNKIETKMKKLGWKVISTGGGCLAYNFIDNSDPDKYYLLTATDGISLPTRLSQKIMISANDESSKNDSFFRITIGCNLRDILNKVISFKNY